MAKDPRGSYWLSLLTPAQYAELFPSYYKKQLPDIGRSVSGGVPMSGGGGGGSYSYGGGSSAGSSGGYPRGSSGSTASYSGADNSVSETKDNRPAWQKKMDEEYNDVVRKEAVLKGDNPLAQERQSNSAEANDVEIQKKMYALTLAEVGPKNESAQRALMETIYNRKSAQNKKSLDATMGRDYYEPFQNGAFNKWYSRIQKDPELFNKLHQRHTDGN